MPRDQGSSIAKIVAGEEERILADWLEALKEGINLRGGRITGTTAELWLARATNEAISEAQVPAEAVGPVDEGRTYTVLVVEDDALILMSTVEMLKDLGHTVIEAYSGPAALDIL